MDIDTSMKKIFVTLVTFMTFLATVAAQGQGYVFPQEVAPLLTTEWGQEHPYNRMCPTVMIDSVEKHLYAGCGPLVMSQVIRRYGRPSQSVRLGHRYQWHLMSDRVTDTLDIAVQDAVARLIRDCGTAAETNYRLSASSTKLNSVVTGLKSHFGYNRYMHISDRDFYPGESGSRAWKTIIYNELRSGRPVIIRGEKSAYNAHVFIIDGCRDSLVHVNWGWGGRRNGYYHPDTLYGFRAHQRMVTGVTPETVRPKTKRVDVERPGRLASYITEDDWLTMQSIKVTGSIGREDIALLRRLAGGGGGDKSSRRGNLAIIDLSESVILTLPDSAFCGSERLTYISLPITLPEIGNYAFAGCSHLNEIRIHTLVSHIGQRAFSGYFNLIEVKLPRSLRTIGANAFNSCNSLTEVTLPHGVTFVGNGAFAYARNLRKLVVPKTLRELGQGVTKGTKVKKLNRI